MSENWGGSPIHPIINRAHEFAIERFDYHVCRADDRESFIDLHLRRGDELRRLRFLEPSLLKIDAGFPQPTGGMVILDIAYKGWDRTRVEVADFEASHGEVTFYAADVIDLDKSELSN